MWLRASLTATGESTDLNKKRLLYEDEESFLPHQFGATLVSHKKLSFCQLYQYSWFGIRLP